MKSFLRSSVVFGALFTLASANIASADGLFPLSSGRPQVDGNCWAYGASHMLEARAEFRDHISVMTDIEKSYRYYLIYDRLMNAYQTKTLSEGDGSGDGINDIGGFAADLLDIYQNHGFELLSVRSVTGTSDLPYPSSHSYRNAFQGNSDSDLSNGNVVSQAERQLISGTFTEAQARTLIETALAQAFRLRDPFKTTTQWTSGTQIPVKDTFSKLLGSDMQDATRSFVLLTTSYTPENNKKWVRYNSGKNLAIGYTDKKAILKVVRASIDHGWPATAESIDHVMTFLGYKTTGTNQYSYQISDSSGAYASQGISWVTETKLLRWFVDSTVYYDTVKDLVPAQDISKQDMKSVKLPRKHL